MGHAYAVTQIGRRSLRRPGADPVTAIMKLASTFGDLCIQFGRDATPGGVADALTMELAGYSREAQEQLRAAVAAIGAERNTLREQVGTANERLLAMTNRVLELEGSEVV